MGKNKKRKSISSWISTIILIVFLLVAYNIYTLNNFNEFKKAKNNMSISSFTRDKQVKYSDTNSYKIESEDFNDVVFYKKIKVNPYTPYKVTCMVKTQDVMLDEELSLGGAHISITDTVERSRSIAGTNDWQKVELLFNSKNREYVEIGFRLGGYEEQAKGTAWFSEFKIEEGIADDTTNWKFACFIFDSIDVTLVNGQNIDITMTPNEVKLMEENIRRFQNSCQELSENRMSVDYEIIKIEQPITTISYDNTNGYYISDKDVDGHIREYIENGDYDHIFIVAKLGDILPEQQALVSDWIGLRRYGLLWNWIFKY